MSGESRVAAWAELHRQLVELAHACGGTFAAVVDEGNGLWCTGVASVDAIASDAPDRAADRFYRAEIAPRSASMRRGVPVSVVRGSREDEGLLEGADRYVAESFASVYVLVVWFRGSFGGELARARVRRVLPAIEAVVLSLPPLGPGTDAGARKLRT